MNSISLTGNPSIRFAEETDYEQIKLLLQAVNLPTEGVRQNIDNFLVLRDNRHLIGTVGLEIYGNKALLRSLAVTKRDQNRGYGKILCTHIIKHARELKMSEIYLLTDSAEKFFKSQGFKKIAREKVDRRVKSSLEFSVLCPESAACLYLEIG